MLESELYEAIQNKDWDTAQKIEALLVSKKNRVLHEIREQVEVQKIVLETKKMKKDYQFIWISFLTAIAGVCIAVGTFIKSFF